MYTREVYKIISDHDELKKFIDTVLPNLLPNETFYVCLFARNKYCKELTHIKSDKAQLKRFTTTKEMLIQKLKQLECPIGSYMQKETPVPQEALAVYISINPRHFIKAAHKSLITLSTLIATGATNYNPHQNVISNIQKSAGRKVYTDFDFDFTPEDKELSFDNPIGRLLAFVCKCVNYEAVTCIETRGGCHILVNHELINSNYKNTWYNSLKELGPDNVGDTLIPIPGCYQGGFTPKIIN